MRYWLRFYRDFDDPKSSLGAAISVQAGTGPEAAAQATAAQRHAAKSAGAEWLVVFNARVAPVHREQL